MKRTSALLATLAIATSLAGAGPARSDDKARDLIAPRQPVKARDLINKNLDATLDAIAREALAGVAVEPPRRLPVARGDATLLDAIAREALAGVGVNAPRPVPVPRAPGADGRLAFFRTQAVDRLRPTFAVELEFARTVAGLTEAEVVQILPDAERGFDAAVAGLAASKWGVGFGCGLALEGRREPLPDSRGQIQRALAGAIRARFPADRAARYEAEVARRDDERRRAGALGLVARLDAILLLSARQRDDLTASLSSNWNPAWFEAEEAATGAPPSLPPYLILPHLTATQRRVWLGTVKEDFGLTFHGIPAGVKVRWGEADVLLLEAELVEAPPEPKRPDDPRHPR